MKKHTDHIYPLVEGGPDEQYNKRRISAKENLQKGARMPSLNEVSQSTNPMRLAVKIDRDSLSKEFKHPRNKNRGFGGLPR